MNFQHIYISLLIAISTTLIMQCGPDQKTKKIMDNAKTRIGVIPESMPGSQNDTQALIKLGEKLYHDKRLSINDTQSCNSCHNVLDGGSGVDNQKFSKGALPGTIGGRNSPTVLNAGFHIAQFWDGRAATLSDQAKGPILNPVEMGMPDSETVIKKISQIEEYQKLFISAFPESEKKITYSNLADAIASFERTLITRDQFDDFMNGDATALNPEEIKGFEEFSKVGCMNCHNGPLLGGNSYRKLGEIKPYANQSDKGRFEVTKNPSDTMVFKVSSLRNVAVTAPYFHDGSATTLEDAIKTMAHVQLGKELEDAQIKSIATFLKSLTGKNLKK